MARTAARTAFLATVVGISTTVATLSCRGGDPKSAAPRDSLPGVQARAGIVVDSALPPEELMRRFRVGLDSVSSLDSASTTSRDRLIRRFVRAVADRDSLALRAMRLSRAEFAYLYFPSTQYVRAPYVTAPDVIWQLMEARGESGMKRLVTRVGGGGLQLVDYSCEQRPKEEGRNRLFEQCRIRYRRTPSDTVEQRKLFGSIIERDGRYKFVSYANDF